MQQQMMQQMPSNSSCKKPGQGQPKPGPSAGDIKKMQEKLSQQLKEMKEKMAKGGKDGKGGQDGQKGMSEQLAKMAAQQEALRRQMQQMLDKIKKDVEKALDAIKELPKEINNETDISELINIVISNIKKLLINLINKNYSKNIFVYI